MKCDFEKSVFKFPIHIVLDWTGCKKMQIFVLEKFENQSKITWR